MMKRAIKFFAALCLGMLAGSCSRDPELPGSMAPTAMAPYVTKGSCPACSAFSDLTVPEGSSLSIWVIQHPDFGSTFYVNIDHDRNIVKLKPVRDPREAILFYDPFGQGSPGMEVGSNYVQPRCDDGGNRFQLAVAFIYPPGAGPDDYATIVIAGMCTMTEEVRVIFTDGGY